MYVHYKPAFVHRGTYEHENHHVDGILRIISDSTPRMEWIKYRQQKLIRSEGAF